MQTQTTTVLGLMGKKRCGKSTVGAALRACAGSTNPGADIEFSDAILDVINCALTTGVREYHEFRRQLVEGARQVLASETRFEPLDRFYHNHADHERPPPDQDCPECALASWLPRIPLGFEITRDNKDPNRQPQMWLGIIMRQLAGSEVWAREVTRRISVALADRPPLITVGGVRFRKDAELVRSAGGFIGRIIGLYDNVHDTDPTNAEFLQVPVDFVLHNTVYGLDAVDRLAADCWADLGQGRYRPDYGPAAA
jgi:hypothetical protein